MSSLPLERYAVIGDMRTIGVVADTGSLDWLCWPRFDSPSIFGRLLDPDGGHWQIEPVEEPIARRQVYVSATNVLITRSHTETGVVEVEDLMVVDDEHRVLVRRARCLRGHVDMRSEADVRPDYGRGDVHLDRTDDTGFVRVGLDTDTGEAVTLAGSAPLTIDGTRVTSEFSLDEGDEAWFSLGDVVPDDVGDDCDSTLRWWQAWSAKSTYRGRWREAVERSALTLKLLTNAPTGGLIAAGTTSLPEAIGGERNWDYRYVWIRDAAFTLYALLELGYGDEAAAFTDWLTKRLEHSAHRCDDPNDDSPPLAPLYDLDGNHDIAETTLDHWRGYRESTPVRVGNAASGQTQLDIYGELIDSIYLADKQSGVSLATWAHIRTLVNWVVDHWQEPDDGMWEARSGPQRHTASLLMCWVAVERAMRMAHHGGRPADLTRWREARDEMHATLVERGYNDDLGAFTQLLDGDTVDASILLAPLLKFVSPHDPRWLSTLDVVGEKLAHGPLVDRYDQAATDDGLDGGEGSFTICSFWYVEALARSGRVEEARILFDRLLSYATPTGLFSEEIGPDGRLLGNFPQAFTHLALISAAVCLDERLDP